MVCFDEENYERSRVEEGGGEADGYVFDAVVHS